MKQILLVIFILVSAQFISAQQIIIRKTDSADCFSFVKVKDGIVSRYKEPYNVLAGSEFKCLKNWGFSNSAILYWTNGENIYKCDLADNKGSVLIYSHLRWILEFFVRGDFIYIINNPTKEEGPYDNRYSDGLQFFRINIRTLTKEKLHLPPGYNVTNLAISWDEKWASFIHTRGDQNPRYELILYDLLKGHLKIIDSADSKQSAWFGNDDEVNSAYWADSDSLLYYKHVRPNDYGRIMAYNVKSKNKKVWLKNFPERDFTWFSINDGYIYCAGRNDIYRTKDGIIKEMVFEDRISKSNILDAVVLPY